MSISKKLETIYHNGQPDGIRLVRRNLSTMTTYIIPRPLLTEAKSLQGITRPGIYYLIHENDNNKIAQIYVGQTRNGVIRLDDHNRSKDFWNKAIMFLADSKTFTLDMISGLEKYAIQKAMESKRYTVENSVVPKYEIDEYDLASVEEIYEEIQFMQSLQRGLGSIDIVAAMRSVMVVGKLKKDPSVRILAHEKSSLAPNGTSLAFSLEEENGFIWIGEYQVTADDLLAGTETKRETKMDAAIALIRKELANGKVMSCAELDRLALEKGIPGRTLREARKAMGDELIGTYDEHHKRQFRLAA